MNLTILMDSFLHLDSSCFFQESLAFFDDRRLVVLMVVRVVVLRLVLVTVMIAWSCSSWALDG